MYNTSVDDSCRQAEQTTHAGRYALALALLCPLWIALRYFLGGYAGQFLPAAAAGAVALAALPLMDARKPLKSFLLACLPFALVNILYLFSPYFYPGDTFNYHYPVFQHTASHFQTNSELSGYFPVSGGLRAAAYHINLFPFSPFRLLGIGLSAAQMPAMSAYKLQVFVGMLVTALGWWLLLLKATGDVRAAFFGLLAFLPGGATFTLHQEQVLMTMHIAPWFVLCLLMMKEHPVCGPLALVLFCSGLSAHYPQIQVIALPLCALAVLVFCGRKQLKPALLSARSAGASVWIAALLASALALLPMLYVSKQIKLMASPLREATSLQINNLDDYVRLNTMQQSSKTPGELLNYLRSSPTSPDSFAFSSGRPALLAAALALFVWPGGLVAAGLAAVFLALVLGINTPIPEILFRLHAPFFPLFRQWYHFFPFANLALSLCAALGFKFLLERFAARPSALKFAAAALIFLQAADSAGLALKYENLTRVREIPPVMETFVFERHNVFGPAQIMQYASRKKLGEASADGIPQGPNGYSTLIFSENGGAGLEQMLWARQQKITAPVLDITEARLKAEDPQVSLKRLGNGLVQARLATRQLMVVPFNYDMGWIAENNTGQQTVYRANGALCAFFATGGVNRLSLRPQADGYPLAAEAASGILILAIGMLIFCALRKTTFSSC